MKDYHLNLDLESIVYINESREECIEQWRDIPEYEGLYQVSDLGRVKSLDRCKNHSSGKGTFLSKEKIMKQSKSGAYYSVGLYKCSKSKNYLTHHLVSIAFLNHFPRTNDFVIDHKDNVKEHNMLSNLQIITHRNNSSKDKLNLVGFTGVSKTKNGFVASIQHKGKLLNLGVYENPNKASEKYNEAVKLINSNSDVSHLVKTRSNVNLFTGVCKNKGKFQARIIIDNKFVNLGIFETAELAGIEYQKALDTKNKGGKVMPTKNIKVSKVGFKGVYKSGVNFRVRMFINGINRDLGTLSNLELANERYLEVKKLIIEGKSIEHFYSKKSPNKTYRGVFKNGDKFQAKITIKGKTNNLGSYNSPESARDIYEKAVFILNKGQDIEHLIKRKKTIK